MTLFQTPRFLVRALRPDDAEALLACYADKTAVSHMNDDNCWNDFYIPDADSMRRAIEYWEQDPAFERLAVVSLAENVPIGTLELCLFDTGTMVLRVDVAAACEQAALLHELIAGALRDIWARYPAAAACVVKAHPHSVERRAALNMLGFIGEVTFHGYPHYYEKKRG